MKITKRQLKQIIKEELQHALKETSFGLGYPPENEPARDIENDPLQSDTNIVWSDRNGWRDAKERAQNTYATQDLQDLQAAVGNSYNIIDPFDRSALQHAASGGGNDTTIVPLGTYLTSDTMGVQRLVWFKTTGFPPSYGYVTI